MNLFVDRFGDEPYIHMRNFKFYWCVKTYFKKVLLGCCFNGKNVEKSFSHREI